MRRCVAIAVVLVWGCGGKDQGPGAGPGGGGAPAGAGGRPAWRAGGFPLDAWDALRAWWKNLQWPELAGKAKRVRVVMRTAEAVAGVESADMRVVADGKVVSDGGGLPEWEPELSVDEGAIIAGMAELPEAIANGVAAAWSLSGPPKT